ncbi:MAG: hypothetical protein PVI67_02695, partial [Anaerolineae bacterium]
EPRLRRFAIPYISTVFDISADMPYNVPSDAGSLVRSGSCAVWDRWPFARPRQTAVCRSVVSAPEDMLRVGTSTLCSD